MSAYELWDIGTGNALGSFESEGEAVLALSQLFSRHGCDGLESLVLLEVDRPGITTLVAQDTGEMIGLIEHRGMVSAR